MWRCTAVVNANTLWIALLVYTGSAIICLVWFDRLLRKYPQAFTDEIFDIPYVMKLITIAPIINSFFALYLTYKEIDFQIYRIGFKRSMRKAANVLDKIGEHELAEEIRKLEP